MNTTNNAIQLNTTTNHNDGSLLNAGTGAIATNFTHNYNGTLTMNGNIQIGVGSQTFNDGVTINGTGNLTVFNTPTMNDVTLNKALVLNSGSTLTINAGKTLTTAGGLTANTSTANVTINGGGTLLLPTVATGTIVGNPSSPSDVVLNNITVNNQGNFVLNNPNSDSELFLNDGTVFNNNGTITFAGSSDSIQTGAGVGTLNNSGSIVSSTGLTATIATTNFSNNGGTLGSLATGQTGGLIITPVAQLSGASSIAGNQISFTQNTINNVGILLVDNGVTFNLTGKSVTGSGTLQNDGLLVLSGTTIAGSLVNTGDIQQTGSASIIQNTFEWQSGTVSGTSALSANNHLFTTNGTRVLDGATIATGSAVLEDGSLEVVSGTLSVDGSLDISSPATFTLTGGEFNASILNVDGSVMINHSESFNTGLFNNNGLVQANAGTLDITGNGTHTGTFFADTGATINFLSGTHQFDDGSVFDGAGTFTKNVNANLNLIGTNVGLTIGSLASINLNQMNFGGGGNLTNLGNIFGINSTFTGDLYNEGTAELDNATFNGMFVNRSSGLVTITNSTINGDFENSGNITVLGSLNFFGALATQLDGSLTIENGNTFSVAGVNSIFDWQGGSIGNNAGVAGNFTIAGANADLRISGNGVRIIEGINITYDANLNLDGTLEIRNNGSLTLNGANNTVNAGALLKQTSGAFNNNGTLNVQSGGRYQYVSGTFGGTGDLANTGTLDLGNAMVTNAITNSAGATINASGATFTQTFTNNGTLDLSGSNSFQGGIQLNSGAQITGAGTADLNDNSLGLSDGVSLAGVAFTNVDTVSVGSGQTVNLTNVSIDSNSAFDNSGTLNVSGNVDLLGGYVQNAGITRFDQNNTNAITTGASGFVVNNGQIQGTGTINGDLIVGTATLAPGYSPGAITINGNLVLNSSSVLNIELGGNSSSLFDIITVNGTTTLGGTLNVVSFNGFVPSAGSVFDFMSFTSSSGAFSSITFDSALGSGLQFTSGAGFLRLFVPSLSPTVVSSSTGSTDFGNNLLIAFMPYRIEQISSDRAANIIEEADEGLEQCI